MSIGGKKSSAPAAVQRPSEAEKALAQRSAREWNDFLQYFVPVQNEFVRAVEDRATPRSQLGASVSSAAAQQSGLSPEAINAALNEGAAPSSGRTVMDVGSRSDAFVRALAAGRAALEPKLAEREIKGLLKVSAVGRGIDDSLSVALENEARNQTNQAIAEAERRLAKEKSSQDGFASTLGTLAGVASGIYSMKTPPIVKPTSGTVINSPVSTLNGADLTSAFNYFNIK